MTALVVRFAAALALALALLSLIERAAHAQGGAVDLYVDPSLAATDREAVRAAVERDLGRPVQLVDRVPRGDGLTVTKAKGASARVAFRSGSRLTERAVDLPADPAERVQTLALLSGNVVRDEAAELLGQLQLPPAPPPPSSAQPESPQASAPKPPDAAKAPKAPKAPKSAEPSTSEPPAPEARPEKPEPAPIQCIDPATADYVGGDFVPYVGLSSVRGRTGTRFFSVNALGGLTRGIYGAELGGLFNLTLETSCGAKLAGIADVVLGSTRGFQFGGIASVTGDRVDGVQLAGIVNWAGGLVRGSQLSGIANWGGDGVEGSQLTGIANFTRGPVDGAQVGLVNVATGHARVQIGLLNVAESADVPIGLVSITKKGRTQAFASVASWGLVSAGIRHESGFIHNVYGIGARPFGDPARGVVTGGIGIAPVDSERLTLDVDALCHTAHSFRGVSPVTIAELRVPIGVKLGDRFTLWGAPAYDVAVGESASEVDVGSFAVSIFDEGPSTFVRGFPSVTAGATLEL